MAINVSMPIGRVGKALGYTGFFIVALLFFLVLTFPDDKLRGFLSSQASHFLGAPVAIDEGGLTGIRNIDLSGIQVRLRPIAEPKLPGAPAAAATKKKPKFRMLTADRVSAEVSIISAIFGEAYEATFDGELMGGRVEGGTFSYRKDRQKISFGIASLQDLVFGSERLIKGLTAGETFAGVDLRGKLSGAIDASIGRKPTDLRGSISLSLSAARVLNPVLPQGLELTDVDLGTVRLKITIDEVSNIPILGKRARRARSRRGKTPQGAEVAKVEPVAIHFAELSNESDEIVVSMDPRSVIRILPGKPFDQAVADIHFAVELLPAFRDKKVTDKETGEQVAKNKTPLSLMKGLPQVRAATLNGVIGIKCTGALKKISCKLARPRRGSIKTSKPKFGRDRKAAKKPPVAKTKKKPARPSKSSVDRKRDSPRATSAADRARERAERRREAAEKRRLAAEKRRTTATPRRPIAPPKPGLAGRVNRTMSPSVPSSVELSPGPQSPRGEEEEEDEPEGEDDDAERGDEGGDEEDDESDGEDEAAEEDAEDEE